MKLRDYRTLLVNDKQSAMVFDLTERFPRGPTTRLRAKNYKDEDGSLLSDGWGSSEVPYLAKGVDTAEGSTRTAGWNPYEIYELDDDEWRVAQLLRSIEVPVEMAMAKNDTWGCDDGYAKLFKNGAQITRRARRMARRIRMAKKWVQENIGTAVYKVQLGGWGEDNAVYVHADSEEGAMKQWELFMKNAFTDYCDNYRSDRVHVEYCRPAKTPLELMILNEPMQREYRTKVEQKKKAIIKLQKEIEAMDTAEQIVNIYAVNMVATWGTGEGEDADA